MGKGMGMGKEWVGGEELAKVLKKTLCPKFLGLLSFESCPTFDTIFIKKLYGYSFLSFLLNYITVGCL